ncbi:unnamed protein product [Ilex paraguariensis]|uniref:Uncharacterized protein n=1 Tax=Ilex paraguariensis TaxID=185542 RepID=A0ABC8R9Z6_9AQUA
MALRHTKLALYITFKCQKLLYFVVDLWHTKGHVVDLWTYGFVPFTSLVLIGASAYWQAQTTQALGHAEAATKALGYGELATKALGHAEAATKALSFSNNLDRQTLCLPSDSQRGLLPLTVSIGRVLLS